MTAAILEVCEVSKHYGSTLALDCVSFDVQEGEVFGLLGPNGAGKTTLLSIVSCLLEPDSGEVRLLGRPLVPGDREVRRLIGVVPQELALYGELTARENLVFFGELYGICRTELNHRVDQILVAIGLEDKAGDRVRTFSGGMKRRLNLGIALVHGPRLLLLDEPTVGVDPQSRNHIFEEVRRLNGEGMTLVYTSHYMEEVQALCGRIGIMDHGRLKACDTLPHLLQILPGAIRFRVTTLTPALHDQLEKLPGAVLRQPGGRSPERPRGDAFHAEAPTPLRREQVQKLPGILLDEYVDDLLELVCDDVKTTLVDLMRVLQQTQAELVSLDIEETNLERVFLHLTGRQLRD